MAEPVPVLMNATARGAPARRRRALTRALAFAGRNAEFHDAASPDDATAWVGAQVGRGDRVVIAGGDGLVHLAVQAAANTRLTLGLVPSGTGNDFARALQISSDIAAAAVGALIDPVALDVMRINDSRLVASVVTLGFSGDVNERANRLRRPRGALRYTWATLLELRGLRPLALRITLDDETIEVDATLVSVANTAYFGGGMLIAPSADPTDGIVDVCVIKRVGRFELLRVFPQVFRGAHVHHRAVSMYRARRVIIESTDGRPIDVWGDGEKIGTLPIDVRVLRSALRIAGARPVVPKSG